MLTVILHAEDDGKLNDEEEEEEEEGGVVSVNPCRCRLSAPSFPSQSGAELHLVIKSNLLRVHLNSNNPLSLLRDV